VYNIISGRSPPIQVNTRMVSIDSKMFMGSFGFRLGEKTTIKVFQNFDISINGKKILRKDAARSNITGIEDDEVSLKVRYKPATIDIDFKGFSFTLKWIRYSDKFYFNLEARYHPRHHHDGKKKFSGLLGETIKHVSKKSGEDASIAKVNSHTDDEDPMKSDDDDRHEDDWVGDGSDFRVVDGLAGVDFPKNLFPVS